MRACVCVLVCVRMHACMACMHVSMYAYMHANEFVYILYIKGRYKTL